MAGDKLATKSKRRNVKGLNGQAPQPSGRTEMDVREAVRLDERPPYSYRPTLGITREETLKDELVLKSEWFLGGSVPAQHELATGGASAQNALTEPALGGAVRPSKAFSRRCSLLPGAMPKWGTQFPHVNPRRDPLERW